MAVTAHWIEAVVEKGSQKTLWLRSDLVGFHKLPGRHTGEHLAHCFLFITDRLKITEKVSRIIYTLKLQQTLIASQMGWITCDNASNNDTMFTYLSILLQKRKIKINMSERRIR